MQKHSQSKRFRLNLARTYSPSPTTMTQRTTPHHTTPHHTTSSRITHRSACAAFTVGSGRLCLSLSAVAVLRVGAMLGVFVGVDQVSESESLPNGAIQFPLPSREGADNVLSQRDITLRYARMCAANIYTYARILRKCSNHPASSIKQI